jgi:hypothetical protein
MKDYTSVLESIADYGKAQREIGVKFAQDLDLEEAKKLNYAANKKFFEIAKEINELLTTQGETSCKN